MMWIIPNEYAKRRPSDCYILEEAITYDPRALWYSHMRQWFTVVVDWEEDIMWDHCINAEYAWRSVDRYYEHFS